LADEQPSRASGGTPRKGPVIALAVAMCLLFIAVFSQTWFNLAFLRPSSWEETLVFSALSALVFLLLIALSFVLLRNLLKLYAERRMGVLGSKFRTRMVAGALLLSFVPVILLFLFAYGLMNRSIEKWFSLPVEQLSSDSSQVASQLSGYALENARTEAEEIASQPEAQQSFQTGNYAALMQVLRSRQTTLQGGFVLVFSGQDLVAAFDAPGAWAELKGRLPSVVELERQRGGAFVLNGQDYIAATATGNNGGRILIAMPLPPEFRRTLDRIDASQVAYRRLSLQSKQLRRTYTGLLLLLTVVALFAATWLALFLAKLVTRPVQALAEATQEISRGRYDYRVQITAADELGELVASFNHMASELEGARHSMEDSSRQLAGANVELEQRRRHMETILESIPTGVLSLDAGMKVTRANPALGRILSLGGKRIFAEGSALSELFPPEVVSDLQAMMRKAERMGSVTQQMEIQVQRARLNVAVTAASLHYEDRRLGYVLVFDDLSDLLRANKQAAWREVARRVAHEIKNPLTPIALSAERIRRHLERGGSMKDELSQELLSDCAQTIASAVETVRSLVDEFSAMARFPTSQPQPSDANAIVESTLAMFNGRLDGIRVETQLAEGLPPVMADPTAMQRALANLIDNAAEALQGCLVREVHISTALLEKREAVEIIVADTGPGVDQEAKEKLFFPYFSTKKRGTGLGLAIVGRIIEEHHGSVRVEENSPVGTRFIVELPIAPEAAAREAQPEAQRA